MKQHLRIKSFWRTALNAVKIQMYCAVIAYGLVALVDYKLKVDRRIYEILQIISISILEKTPIREILTKCDYNKFKEREDKQLIIRGGKRPLMIINKKKFFLLIMQFGSA